MNNLLRKFYTSGPFGFYGGGAGGGTGTSGTSGQTYGTSGTSGASGMTPSDYLLTAYLATNQTILTGGSNKVVNLTAGSDAQGWLNANTFQPNIAGFYQITYNVLWGIGTGTGQINVQVTKNGSTQVIISQAQVNTIDSLSLGDATIVYMNGTTDSLQLTAYTSTSSASQVLQAGSGTQFNAALIGYGGLDGSSGTSGSDGSTGSSGTSGAAGSSGTSGSTGLTGSSGTSGANGAAGSSGTSGANGATGSSGTSGAGSAGTSGANGSSGTSGVGTAGTSGSSGVSGNGTAGTSGAQGAAGSSGTSGVGSAGTSGSSGTSSAGAAGAIYNYKVVVATTGGTISAITSATSPSGANLIGAPGWSFSISGVNVIVGHPLGNTITGAFSEGLGTANVLIRPYSGTTTATFASYQNLAYTQVTFYSNTAANAGFNGAGSDANALTINFQSIVSV